MRELFSYLSVLHQLFVQVAVSNLVAKLIHTKESGIQVTHPLN